MGILPRTPTQKLGKLVSQSKTPVSHPLSVEGTKINSGQIPKESKKHQIFSYIFSARENSLLLPFGSVTTRVSLAFSFPSPPASPGHTVSLGSLGQGHSSRNPVRHPSFAERTTKSNKRKKGIERYFSSLALALGKQGRGEGGESPPNAPTAKEGRGKHRTHRRRLRPSQDVDGLQQPHPLPGGLDGLQQQRRLLCEVCGGRGWEAARPTTHACTPPPHSRDGREGREGGGVHTTN